MAVVFPYKLPDGFVYQPLPDDCALEVGKLVRATAELEDVVNMFLTIFTRTNHEVLSLFLGTTGLSRKLELIRTAIDRADDKEHAESILLCYEKWFAAPGMKEALNCRNAVAHGVYIGLIGDAHTFMTDRFLATADGDAGYVSYGFRVHDIAGYRKFIENIVDAVDAGAIEPICSDRLARRTPDLTNHPKARPPSKGRS